MTETWAPVVGYEGLYQVSSDGRVRSIDRITVKRNGRRQRSKGKILAVKRNPVSGYPEIGLRRPGNQTTYAVHSLVAEAFIGPRPAGMDVRHYPDPDPANVRLSNLQYGTRSQNSLDSVEHGTHNHASKTACKHGHKLTGNNLYINPFNGSRVCITCRNRYKRDYRRRLKCLT